MEIETQIVRRVRGDVQGLRYKMDYISEFPDCVLSYILSKLSIKDLVKTSILSKRWCKLWALKRDLNFDVNNVLGSEKDLLEAGYLDDVLETDTMVRYLDLSLCGGEFIRRVDQFVKNFQGTKIDSFLLNFYLNCNQSSTIDKWISFAIARGAERIDLLFFGRPYAHRNTSRRSPYKFPFLIFSKSNASTLKHMSLLHCRVCCPTNFDFIPFSNLRSLDLASVKVDEIFITRLLSNCLQLEELSLVYCEFESSVPKIASSSLRHLEVSNCFVLSNNIQKTINLRSLDCPKLTSLEYRGGLEALSINTLVLNSINYAVFYHVMPDALSLFATLPQLEIMHLHTLLHVTTTAPKIAQPLKHLRQLNFMISWDMFQEVEFDLLWILTVLQASPLLQKLSVMVTYPKFFENQKDMTDLEIYSHEELEVIEIGGCVGNWYEIEFAMNVLKYAHKLKRIVMSPYWREDNSFDWNSDPVVWFKGRERILEKLQGRAELVLL